MNVQKISNTLWIVTVPVKDFWIEMLNSPKKVSGLKNYANASFFKTYSESNPKANFTLPVGHVVCDVIKDTSTARQYWCDHYMKQRGPTDGKKYCFDSTNYSYDNAQFYGKSLTTFYIKNGVANIADLTSMNLSYTYAITGIPLILNGHDVSWANYVKKQGWYGSELYGTYHVILAIKKSNDTNVYIIGWKSTSGNMISSGEAYKMLKAQGFYSAVKLDGGGSMVLDANGSRMQTSENRQINTILRWNDNPSTSSNTSIDSVPATNKPANNVSGQATANVNMRQGPGTNYAIIGVVANGSVVAVDKNGTYGSWYKVTYNGKSGYCSSSYIKLNSTTQTPTVDNNSKPDSSKNPYTVPSRTLKFGCKGSDVFWLQTELVHRGYDIGKSGIDGEFGSATRSAVKKWQADNNLVVDGYFGPASLKCMLSK